MVPGQTQAETGFYPDNMMVIEENNIMSADKD